MAMSDLQPFNKHFSQLKETHGVTGELKWHKISKSHGAINMVLDLLAYLGTSETAQLDVIVVQKELYQKWKGTPANKEEAFYVTYTLLLKYLADNAGRPVTVYIDDRPDAYAKQHEAVEVITNRMLRKSASWAEIAEVSKEDSKYHPAIQTADVFTGAITAGHREYLDSEYAPNLGKRLAMERISRMFSWDALCYDTKAYRKFNVWHFPIQYRETPATRDIVLKRNVPYVKAEDLG